MQVKFKRSNDSIQLPEYKRKGDAGADLRSCEEVKLYSGQTQVVKTGLFPEIPEGYEGQIRNRSGQALNGIIVTNAPGTIDSNYRGEIGIILTNLSREDFEITPGMRIAQLVIAPVTTVEFIFTDTLEETERGSSGFGSSGTH